MQSFKRSNGGADKGDAKDAIRNYSGTNKTVDGCPPEEDGRQQLEWNQWWKSTTDRLVAFWYADLPPLYGPLRFFFYGLQWMITLPWFPDPSTPHNSLFSVQKCEFNRNELVHFPNLGFKYNHESGIFGYLLTFIDDPSTFWLFDCHALVGTLKVCIIMCALGFGWKIPRALVAFTYWLMSFIKQSAWSSKNTHSTLLGAFAFVGLTFAENNLIDRWSMDSLLVSWYKKYRPQSQQQQQQQTYIIHGAAAGGAARKFAMCVTVVAFFCAGIHKAAEVKWLGWLDGATLKDAIHHQNGHWSWLHNLVSDNDWLCVPMAVMTIIGEVGVVAILLSKCWRPFGIASLYLFHIGVYLLMDPNFICHGIDYLLIIEWNKYYERFSGNNGTATKSTTAILQKSLPPLGDEENPMNCPVPAYSHGHEIPKSWKVGAWLYSTVIAAAFFAGMFRVDGLPFYSWCLYNHHPSDVVVAKPFVQETIEYAAHKCLTQPPLNPACQHLGNYQHHDSFKDYLRHGSRITAIVEDQNNPKCPIGVYNNWELTLCVYSVDAKGMPALIKRAVERQVPAAVNPDPKILPMANIHTGLRRWYTDAIAAAIENGTSCFREDAKWFPSSRLYYPQLTYFWSEDRNPYNPASRFARQLRFALEEPENSYQYLGPGKRIRSIALSFDYIRELFRQDIPMSDRNTCMVGISSVEEEVTDTWGDQEIGNPNVSLPAGDYSKVWTEAIYVLVLTLAIAYGPRWREVFAGMREVHDSIVVRSRKRATVSQKDPIVSVVWKMFIFFSRFQLQIAIMVGIMVIWRFTSSAGTSQWSYDYRKLQYN
jgi:hypothetical protein